MIRKVICPNGHEFPARFDETTESLNCPTCQSAFPVPRWEQSAAGEFLLGRISPRQLAEAELGLTCYFVSVLAWFISIALAVALLPLDLIASRTVEGTAAVAWIISVFVVAICQFVGSSLYLPLARHTGNQVPVWCLMLLNAIVMLSLGTMPLAVAFPGARGLAGVAFLAWPVSYFGVMFVLWREAKALGYPGLREEIKQLARGIVAWLVVPPLLIFLIVAAISAAVMAIVGTLGIALIIALVAVGVWAPHAWRMISGIARRFLDPMIFPRHVELFVGFRSIVGRKADRQAPRGAAAAADENAALPTGLRRLARMGAAVWGTGTEAPSVEQLPAWAQRACSHDTATKTLAIRATAVGLLTLGFTGLSATSLLVRAKDAEVRSAVASEIPPAAGQYVPITPPEKRFIHLRISLRDKAPTLFSMAAAAGERTGHRAFILYTEQGSDVEQRFYRLMEGSRRDQLFGGLVFLHPKGNQVRGVLTDLGIQIPAGATGALLEVGANGQPTGAQSDSTQWGSTVDELAAELERLLK